MNRKILGMCVALVIVVMLTARLVAAKPGEYPKKNDKYVTVETSFFPNVASILAALAAPEYIPTEDTSNVCRRHQHIILHQYPSSVSARVLGSVL